MISIWEFFYCVCKGIVFSREIIVKVCLLLKMLFCENDSFYFLIKLFVIFYELLLDKGMCELLIGQFVINFVFKEYINEKLNKVLDYVYFYFLEVICFVDVVKMVNMSEVLFCCFIKQYIFKSFIDFFIDICLGVVLCVLVDFFLLIVEIGYDCGFNNLFNFNCIFKKKKGVIFKEFCDNYCKNKIII